MVHKLKLLEIWLTLTLDVFKSYLNITNFSYSTRLTLTLDVFKFRFNNSISSLVND